MFIIVLIGFGPAAYSVFSGVQETSLLLHSHAILFLGWLFFYALQATLPAFGRVDLHVKLGKLGLPLALILVVNGLFVTFDRFSLRVHSGKFEEASYFLLQPLTDILAFFLIVIAAVSFRKQTEVHKRLMLLATVVITIPAILRITFMPMVGSKFILWISPILIAILYDLYKKRGLHRVYIFGILLFSLIYMRKPLVLHTRFWEDFTTWLIGIVA